MKPLRPIASLLLAIVIFVALYLLFWPVPVEPVAWQAPRNRGLVDPFEANDRLRHARLIDLAGHSGPEDIAGGPDGRIYTGTADGSLVRFKADGSGLEIFAQTGGRPLGLEFDAKGNLFVANAYLGVQRVTPEGRVSTVVDSFEGKPIAYADDIAVGLDGMIYFSDASTKFGAMQGGGTYEASLLDLMEHGGHGRVLRHDPGSGTTTLLLDGLNFANGVAISEDQKSLLINETGSYRVLSYRLAEPDSGATRVVIDNLPGFPDNINNGLNGRFWIGLVAPRNDLLDSLSGRPWLRKIVQRLPAALRPKAVPSSHVFAMTAHGEVLMDLQDSAVQLPALTGVYESRDALWLSTLFGDRAARLDKEDLARP